MIGVLLIALITSQLYAADIKSLLTLAAAERIVDKEGTIQKVPCFDQRLPLEIKDKIVGYMLQEALKTLPMHKFVRPYGFFNDTQSLAWHPSGKYLARSDSHSTTALFETSASMKYKKCAEYENKAQQLLFDRTGTLLAFNGSYNDSYGSRALNVVTFEQVFRDSSHYLAFCPSDDLVACFDDNSITIFNTENNRRINQFPSSLNAYKRTNILSWHPHKSEFLMAGLSTIALFNAATGFVKKLSLKKEHEPFFDGIYISPQGIELALSLGTSVMVCPIDEKYEQTSKPELYHLLPSNDAKSIEYMRWSPDGTHLAAIYNGRDSRAVFIIDVARKSVIAQIPFSAFDHQGFAWHPEGHYFATHEGIFTWQAQKRLSDYFFSNDTKPRPTIEQKLFALLLLAYKKQNVPLSVSGIIEKNSTLLSRTQMEEIFYSFPENIRWFLQHVLDLRYKKTWYEYFGDIIEKI